MKRNIILKASIVLNVFLIFFVVVQNNRIKSPKKESDLNIEFAKNDSIISIEKTNPQKEGFIPNKETAIKIAEAIWLPIYGKKVLEEKPFKANLLDSNVWLVSGSLHAQFGGVVCLKIQKNDGKVLKVYHTK
jgi:hypothetical protein